MSSPLAISDPLSAGQADRRSVACDRLRRTGAVLYAAAALTQLGVLLAPDPDPSDHAGLAVVALACALVALALVLWRRPPLAVLHAVCPLGIAIATAAVAVAVAKPVALTSMFYLLPVTLAAYFLQRRAVLANLALVAVGYALALTLFVEPVLRVASFMAVMSIITIVGGVILALTERVGGLVQRLEDLAIFDALTGALNRLPFNERLDVEMARAARSGGVCAVAMIDLDNFKALNDAQGHAAGDAALARFGELVRDGKRRADLFGRVGGEEFVVILVDTDAASAVTYAENLRARLAAARLPVTVSVGIADTAESGASVATLLADADRALYRAKRAGRDRVVRAGRRAPVHVLA
ncbi:MAG: GGDEF domain-containing protein [Actinomycetota bacterium]|nr:GGDEF domain-containing protein [Actinomycetota bacterium]